MKRRRLLLCWGYHRSGWIQPFEALGRDFELHYLFHRSIDEEEGCETEAPRHYWLDFAHAQSVLDHIRPDRIVFMALDGAWVIALNAAARKRAIPTFIVGHGHADADAENVPITVRGALARGSPLPALRFAARSFGAVGLVPLGRTVRFMLDARRHGEHQAMLRRQFDERVPSFHVALSPDSAEVYRRRDRVPRAQVGCIGVPEYDRLFREGRPGCPDHGYVLLLDSPNAENRWNETTVSIEEKVAFLRTLDDIAGSMGRGLRVKLHPESYQAGWLPELAHGVYVRDADLSAEFERAAVCVGFDSTLVVPAVWLRPTVLIRLRPYSTVDAAAETGAANVVSDLGSISADGLEDARRRFEDTEHQRRSYTYRLAFRPDGHAVRRLKEFLSEPETASRRYSLAALGTDHNVVR